MNAKEISGSFTVFVTISLNAVIPIRNVLCYFFGRFTCRSLCLCFTFFTFSFFRATRSHTFFLFVKREVGCCWFSQASKWKHRKIMSFHSTEIEIQIKFSIVCKSSFPFYLNFILFYFIPSFFPLAGGVMLWLLSSVIFFSVSFDSFMYFTCCLALLFDVRRTTIVITMMMMMM